MKKLITLFFIYVLMLSNPALAQEDKTYTKEEIKAIQSRVYDISDADYVAQCINKTLSIQKYQNIKYYEDLQYITAEKQLYVKDVSKPLLALYVARMGWDAVYAVITYGLKSYTLVVDVLLIKLEFKDKVVTLKTAINITPLKNHKTEVRANTLYTMTGKRDGLLIGKLNRLKTVNLKDDKSYEIFFRRLDKEIKNQTSFVSL